MIEPFRIAVPDGEIAELKRRLATTRWADDFHNADWRYGPNGDYLRSLVDYWLHGYDWRIQEAAMNATPQFRTTIDDIPIHFVHVRGKGPSPTPLLMTHGWPWTFWDFAETIGPLTDPVAHGGRAEDAFDVVIPSLPGFVFSSPLRRTGIGTYQTVPIWAELMRRLGYQRYGVHGGDFGAGVSAGLGHAYPERVIGAHLIFPAMLDGSLNAGPGMLTDADFGPDEQDWPAHNAEMTAKTVSHVTAHIHDAQTLAFAFEDSPVGLAAWLLVRRRNASDGGGDLEKSYSRDQLLNLVSLYWFTRTIGTSMRWYAETAAHGFTPVHNRQPTIQAPTAVAVFPREVRKWPRAYVERRANLKRWTVMPRGGHYAPAEEPQLVVDDLRAFFADLRKEGLE